jgi:parallel beta-helix repeat protein
MFLIDSHHVRVTHSSFRRNRDLGILVGLPGFESTHNVIKGNELSRNGSAGIIFEQGDRNRVRRNRSLRDGEGIIVGPGSGNEIARNRIFRSRGNGIAVEKGRGNLVARNVVRRAGKVGIRLALERPLIGGGHNTVRRNQVRGGGGDGVLVDTKDGHSLLRRNHARNNGDDWFRRPEPLREADPQWCEAQPRARHRCGARGDRRWAQPGEQERGCAPVRDREMSLAAYQRG